MIIDYEEYKSEFAIEESRYSALLLTADKSLLFKRVHGPQTPVSVKDFIAEAIGNGVIKANAKLNSIAFEDTTVLITRKDLLSDPSLFMPLDSIKTMLLRGSTEVPDLEAVLSYPGLAQVKIDGCALIPLDRISYIAEESHRRIRNKLMLKTDGTHQYLATVSEDEARTIPKLIVSFSKPAFEPAGYHVRGLFTQESLWRLSVVDETSYECFLRPAEPPSMFAQRYKSLVIEAKVAMNGKVAVPQIHSLELQDEIPAAPFLPIEVVAEKKPPRTDIRPIKLILVPTKWPEDKPRLSDNDTSITLTVEYNGNLKRGYITALFSNDTCGRIKTEYTKGTNPKTREEHLNWVEKAKFVTGASRRLHQLTELNGSGLPGSVTVALNVAQDYLDGKVITVPETSSPPIKSFLDSFLQIAGAEQAIKNFVSKIFTSPQKAKEPPMADNSETSIDRETMIQLYKFSPKKLPAAAKEEILFGECIFAHRYYGLAPTYENDDYIAIGGKYDYEDKNNVPSEARALNIIATFFTDGEKIRVEYNYSLDGKKAGLKAKPGFEVKLKGDQKSLGEQVIDRVATILVEEAGETTQPKAEIIAMLRENFGDDFKRVSDKAKQVSAAVIKPAKVTDQVKPGFNLNLKPFALPVTVLVLAATGVGFHIRNRIKNLSTVPVAALVANDNDAKTQPTPAESSVTTVQADAAYAAQEFPPPTIEVPASTPLDTAIQVDTPTPEPVSSPRQKIQEILATGPSPSPSKKHFSFNQEAEKKLESNQR